jgi:tetratricopeptide (TPR) repeat protein
MPHQEQRPHWTSRDGVLILAIVLGLTGVVTMSRWIDGHPSAVDPSVEEEPLYLDGHVVRRLSLGFNGLMADWYWMRSLQYMGRKLLNTPHDLQLDDLSSLNLKLLGPLLDNATTLDPQFMEPYEYASVVLPAVNVDEAIRIARKGLDANPSAWRLYQQLGYIYWQRGDFKKAGDAYAAGAEIPGSPVWMQAMRARVAVEGGSRSTAREIYARMYQESDDPNVTEMARRHLLQIQSLTERDEIRGVLKEYATHAKRCASSWTDVSDGLRETRLRRDLSGAPLDPTNVPYVLTEGGCNVDLHPQSEVIRK